MVNARVRITRTGRERVPVTLDFADAIARTKQSFKDECDINKIMERWQRTGVIDHLAAHPPTFGDFETAGDYQEACNRVLAADRAFSALPAHIRDRMDNDPATFLAFMQNPDNEAEAVELGLAMKAKGADPAPELTPPAGEESPPETPPTPTPISGGE